MPQDKKVTHVSFVCDHQPLKDKQWRIRLVVGGDELSYKHDIGFPTADIVETKQFLISRYLLLLQAHDLLH